MVIYFDQERIIKFIHDILHSLMIDNGRTYTYVFIFVVIRT